MAEVQWIKLIVGMFDGNSFKRIKRAKIGGVSYRDKLTAVWFELLDLAGKSNANGYLMENEIPYRSFEDIATMLDRDEKEIELCMQYFINERMIEIIDDVYCLSNFMKYQNHDGLEKIREQNRLRQAKYKKKQKLLASNVTDNVTANVTVTDSNGIELDKELEKEIDKDVFTTTTGAIPSLTEVYIYFKELGVDDTSKEAEKFHAYNANKDWSCLPDWKATADLWIARIEQKG